MAERLNLVEKDNIGKNAKFSLTHIIGSLFSLVQGIWNFTLLHSALVIFIHAGNSSKSVKAISSSSKAVTSPSPLIVLKLILSVDKFLKYLEVNSGKSWLKMYTMHKKRITKSFSIYLDRYFKIWFFIKEAMLSKF